MLARHLRHFWRQRVAEKRKRSSASVRFAFSTVARFGVPFFRPAPGSRSTSNSHALSLCKSAVAREGSRPVVRVAREEVADHLPGRRRLLRHLRHHSRLLQATSRALSPFARSTPAAAALGLALRRCDELPRTCNRLRVARDRSFRPRARSMRHRVSAIEYPA